MDKTILIQYDSLQQEIKEVRRRISKTQEEIDKLEVVKDKVKGGEGGIQNFNIEGFPYPEYSRKKTLLYSRKATLETLEMDLLEMTNSVQEYISTIDDSLMRRILTMRFIDGMTQEQIGNATGYERSWIARKIDIFLTLKEAQKSHS